MIMQPKHILLCVCACVCACACTRTVYLPTETVRTEYRADTRTLRVSVSVPRELTAAQRRWIGLGKIAAALLAVAAAIAAVWLYRRIRRRS